MRVIVAGVIGALALALPAQAAVKTVVLVHGAFADGSGWAPVAKILEHDGYKVRIVQEPETSLADDAAATKRVIDAAGPCVLVGHSYGGAVISEAGNNANVKVLVYLAAFVPDVGESALELATKTPGAAKSIEPAGPGYFIVNIDAYPTDFAPDLPKAEAHFMAISQVPVSAAAFGGKATVAAWKDKPSYYIVSTNDRMINPDLERFMSKRAKAQTIEIPSSHVVMQSHPKEAAALIEKAAAAAK